MKNLSFSLTLLALLGLSVEGFAQASFVCKKTGNWSNSNTWTVSSGLDLDGIPDANDNVTITDNYTVTVSSVQYCDSLAISTPNGMKKSCALTVTSNGELYVNKSIFIERDATGKTTFTIEGKVSVNGSFYMYNTKAGGCNNSNGDSSNTLILGNKQNFAQLLIKGNLNLFQRDCAASPQNIIKFYHGNIDVDGNVEMVVDSLGTINTNLISVDDNNNYDGLPKTFYLAGNFNTTEGSIAISDANSNTSFTLYLNGTAAQSIPASGTQFVYKNIDILNTSAEVRLLGSLSNSSLKGNLYVRSNATLNNKGYEIAVDAMASQIRVESNARFINEGIDAFPGAYYNGSPVTLLDDSCYVEFYSAAAVTVLQDNYTFPNLEFTGTGTKTIAGSLDGVNRTAGSINVMEGTLQTTAADNGAYILSSTASGFASLKQKTFVQDYATLEFQNSFTSSPASSFEFGYNSTMKYSKSSGSQTLYDMFANYPTNSSNAQLGNLTLSNASAKELTGKTIEVRRKLSMEDNGSLSLGQSANIIMLSNSSNTAWIGEISSTFGGVSYSGSPEGKFTIQRYIYLPNSKYRDYSAPIQNSTLNDFKNAGMKLAGFTGAGRTETIPSTNNAYTYEEPCPGIENYGFYKATNITNTIDSTANGKLYRRGWRIFTGATGGLTLTLANAGRIYTGDQVFTASFTRSTASRSLDDGWNFFGNPYAASLDWNAIYADNNFNGDTTSGNTVSGIMPTVYIWKPYDNGNPAGSLAYGSYNALTGVGVNLSDGVIPSYQGFWVKLYEDTLNYNEKSFTIKESHKTDTQRGFYKSKEQQKDILARISLSGNNSYDLVGMHYWESSTMGADKGFDILKPPSIPDPESCTISFSENGQPMPMVVNAVPAGQLDYSFELSVNTPTEGTYTLTFENFAQFIEGFECARMTDLLTQASVDLKTAEHYDFKSDATTSGKRFIITLSKSIAGLAKVQQPTCHGNSGKLVMNLKDVNGPISFDLFKGNELVTTLVNQKISEELFAGNYKLADNNTPKGCNVREFSFSIQEPAEIISSFRLKNTAVVAGKPIEFENQSTGAVVYKWTFGDDLSSSNEENAWHIFQLPGEYRVWLRAESEKGDCYTISEQKFIVQEASPAGAILNESLVLDYNGSNITVRNSSELPCQAMVYGIDGKLIASSEIAKGDQVLTVERKNQVIQIVVKQGDNSYQQKLFH